MRRFALTTLRHHVFVDSSNIIYCESDSNYTTFCLTTGDRIVISKTLKHVETLLRDEDFFRIHASYLVNMKHVSKFIRDGGRVVMSNNDHLTVSRKKKGEFFEMFARL